jgi:hypothetical protein
MNLAEALLVAMEKLAPPGNSVFSVEVVPATECPHRQMECRDAHWSSFYNAWVRKESKEAGHIRYRHMAERLAYALKDAKDPIGDAGKVLGFAVNESGFREDVEVGRVSTEKETKQGLLGAGRGPSGEVCVMQILPSMAKRYGTLESFLGDSDDALDRCFKAGLDQIRYADQMCASQKARKIGPMTVGRLFATASKYGTGYSCTSGNHGKTERRVKTVQWVTVLIRNQYNHPTTQEVAVDP